MRSIQKRLHRTLPGFYSGTIQMCHHFTSHFSNFSIISAISHKLATSQENFLCSLLCCHFTPMGSLEWTQNFLLHQNIHESLNFFYQPSNILAKNLIFLLSFEPSVHEKPSFLVELLFFLDQVLNYPLFVSSNCVPRTFTKSCWNANGLLESRLFGRFQRFP